MYKNPELSNQAKRLREELKAAGLELSHAQSMEMMARVQGNRTLHVAHAKQRRQGADISELALQQAADLVFTTLGRYEGNVLGLIESIKAAFLLEETEGSRAVETAMADIFGQKDSPKVSELFDRLMPGELPEYFEQTRQRMLQTLENQFAAPVEKSNPQRLYRGPALDWRLDDGFSLAELPEHHRTAYEVHVQRGGAQVTVDVTVPHAGPDDVEGTHQLGLTVEINQGRPCVHVTNAVYGDMLLSIFATKDGLLMRPEEGNVRTGVLDESDELGKLQKELDAPFALPGKYWFITNPNRP